MFLKGHLLEITLPSILDEEILEVKVSREGRKSEED